MWPGQGVERHSGRVEEPIAGLQFRPGRHLLRRRRPRMISHPLGDLHRPLRPPGIAQVTGTEVGHRPLGSRLNRRFLAHGVARPH
ncbi:MAG: hypothetical protein U0894_01290 [Pirellulales bacterium]